MNTCYWPLHTPGRTANPLAPLADAGKRLLARLEATSEPRVWKTSGMTGETMWSAYDPITQLAIDHASADELRVWLEELHYRN